MTNKLNSTAYDDERVFIFDTTLRDGDQASGFHMFRNEKLAIARQLRRLRVDIIEAGFARSAGDEGNIAKIVREIGRDKDAPVICSLARAIDGDIEAAAKSLEGAYRPRIHTFIATSPIHMKDKLRKTPEQVMEEAVRAVHTAKKYVDEVEFSLEDFGRSDRRYAAQVALETARAGAQVINLPDTVGWLTPKESYDKVKYIIEFVRRKGLSPIFSAHNHNDLGMGTATTIQALLAGARQAEVTINGIGERAGNTALEEIVAILSEKDIVDPITEKKLYCNIDTRQIGPTSRLVSKFTGVKPQPNKAVTGDNANAHASGIHAHGVARNRRTYEILDAEKYGVKSRITLGPRSGTNQLRAKFAELGIPMNEEDFDGATATFYKIAQKRKVIDDADILSASLGRIKLPRRYSFTSYQPVQTTPKEFVVEVNLIDESGRRDLRGRGNGQIDAALNAVRQILPYKVDITDFQVKSVGRGSDCIASTTLVLRRNGWNVTGKGESTDVVSSAIHAIVDGVNRISYLDRNYSERKK